MSDAEGPGREAARGRVETVEATKLESSAARGVAESKATVPHVYAEVEVDLGAWDGRLGEDEGPAPVDAAVWAAARALRDVPRVNAAYRDGRFELYSRANVGVVVHSADGALAATIHDADGKDIEAIAAERRELERRAAEGSITQPDLSGGTFTVSAPGPADGFTPAVHRGQAAALGVGRPRSAPVVRDGQPAAGLVMRLTLACDHRIVSAADAARFLDRLRALLSTPPG